MDQRDREPRKRGDPDREQEHEPTGAADRLDGPEAHHRADEHHPLDPEVEHAGALREQLAEGGVEEGRPVGDRRGEHDDEDRVVHAAASAGTARPRRPKRIR